MLGKPNGIFADEETLSPAERSERSRLEWDQFRSRQAAAAELERQRRTQVVADIEDGTELVPVADVVEARVELPRDPWYLRLLGWLRRSRFVVTAKHGRMDRAAHRDMVEFARLSGHADLLAGLKVMRYERR